MIERARLQVVVLAAGASSRLGEPKALARIGDRAAIDHLLDGAKGLQGCAPPIVVTGKDHDPISAHLHGRDVLVVHCQDWRSGRLASLAAAGALVNRAADLVVAPVDVPLVLATTFRALQTHWERAGAPERGWLAPCLRQGPVDDRRFGHPVLIGRGLAQRLGSFGADTPLKALRAEAEPLLAVETDDPAVIDDLDTQSDLAALCAALDRRSR